MEGYVKLQASTVPGWTIAKAVNRMSELGIPVSQANLVRAAIAAFIGLDENRIREVAAGSRAKPKVRTLDEFLATLEEEGTSQ